MHYINWGSGSVAPPTVTVCSKLTHFASLHEILHDLTGLSYKQTNNVCLNETSILVAICQKKISLVVRYERLILIIHFKFTNKTAAFSKAAAAHLAVAAAS